jgi:hypothetical protein
MRWLLTVGLLGLALAWAAPATAEDARPAGHPASETSVPNSAPPATTTTTTGAHDQKPVIREMNQQEKDKIDKAGK